MTVDMMSANAIYYLRLKTRTQNGGALPVLLRLHEDETCVR